MTKRKHWRDFSERTKQWINDKDAQRSRDYMAKGEREIQERCEKLGITRDEFIAMKAKEFNDIFGANEDEYDDRHSA